ncbi:hypothetical protein DFO68_102130 [Halomonas ventosae]|uniref:Uncharacterized protein n=1 Tax=Halomonas ventosae TaxID=229007 RepID=A0A4R6I2U4_9GAMM|nr:hypothetical protein DFO68_102130 [Halomonas ventosae]
MHYPRRKRFAELTRPLRGMGYGLDHPAPDSTG